MQEKRMLVKIPAQENSPVFDLVVKPGTTPRRLATELRIPGYALLASGLFFLGGIQIFFLGLIGEYVGRIYRQVQQRPLYLLREQNIRN